MPHQTHISSSFPFSNISPSSLPLCLLQSSPTTCYQSSQGEKEAAPMEALKSSLRQEASTHQQQQSLILADEISWAVERGSLLGEVFPLDDVLDDYLLDLGEFAEPEEGEDKENHEQKQTEEVKEENSNSSSSSSSPEPSPPHEIGLPVPDAAELEWVSLMMDDTLLEFPQPPSVGYHLPPPPQPCHGRTQEAKSPTKATICALSTEALVPMKSKRSKRTRATSWSLSGYSSSSSSSSSNSTVTSSSSSSSSSVLLYEPSLLFDDSPPLPKKQKPKKRGRKPKISPPNSLAGAGERRCSHCGVQKTPQWRAGPEGAKTLCNACGVRYKSGRLLPEYRPACSPTFISEVHSNSHRKVLEMRRQKDAEVLASTAPAVASF
ncbi:GATA transcription factor 5-like [Typha latifolia]|uniref:GATA transcription factor 5-like n=1 Tax=Typha latifolia TaxID=4733 RepID=UPI003C2C9E90